MKKINLTTVFQLNLWLFVFMLLFSWNAYSQGLNKFVSITSAKMVEGKRVRSEYPAMSGYVGHCENNNQNEKYLYLWVPNLIQEVGVRVISPIGDYTPDSKDILEPNALLKKDTGFDPMIVFEMPVVPMTDKSKILESGSKVTWKSTLKNDDATEKVTGITGKETASVLRMAATSSKFLGLYRIKISAVKDTKLIGSYLMQAGSVDSNGIIISDNLEDLFKKISNQ